MISIPGSIPIKIYPFFWLLILMLGWLSTSSVIGTIIWALVALFSVLLHEYGHAISARMFGQRSEIHLVALGGVTQRYGKNLSPWKEFIIVLNGPLVGFIVFFIAQYLQSAIGSTKHPLLWYALLIASNVNLFWSIINLFPVLPLDGGHLLKIMLTGLFGQKGIKIALIVGVLIAAAIGVLSLVIQQLWMGVLFLMMAFENYRTFSEIKNNDVEIDDNQNYQKLHELMLQAVKEAQDGLLDDALQKLNYIREQTLKGNLYVSATQYGAHILTQQGRYQKAYEWLIPIRKRLGDEYLYLLQQLAYRVQQWEESVEIGQEVYQKQPSCDSALLNAFSYAIMGKKTPALGWLQCAVQHGLPDVIQVIQKREFDIVRDSTEFQTWLKKLQNSG